MRTKTLPTSALYSPEVSNAVSVLFFARLEFFFMNGFYELCSYLTVAVMSV